MFVEIGIRTGISLGRIRSRLGRCLCGSAFMLADGSSYGGGDYAETWLGGGGSGPATIIDEAAKWVNYRSPRGNS